MRKNLTKKERIRKRDDLRYIFTIGGKIDCQGLKILFAKNALQYSRFAIVIGRKYGNAVIRNQAKRCFREIFRNTKNQLEKGFDIVVVPFPGGYSYDARLLQFIHLARRADIWIT